MNARIDKLLKMNSEKSTDFTLFALAKEYEGMGETQKAISFYELLEKNYENNTGFYYHFAKLMIDLNDLHRFKKIIQQGKKICTLKKDMHALAELNGLYNEYLEEDE